MEMTARVFSDLDELSRAALEAAARIIEGAVARSGQVTVALAGGHTPRRMYELWAAAPCRDRTLWDCVHFFWGDERFVPRDDPRSNFRMAREALLSQTPVPDANVHAFPVNLPDPVRAAAQYEAELRRFFGDSPPAFDLQLLGLGPEGHTASLFPGSSALEEKSRWAMAVEAPVEPRQRLTLTPVVLNQARNTFFLVSGAEKRDIIAALRREADPPHSRYPAARLHPAGPAVWFLDRAAASGPES